MATYSLSGSLTGIKGIKSVFALTPSGSVTDTINFSDGGAGGTFAPTSLSFSSGAGQPFTYVAPAPGTYTLTLTSTGGNTVTGSPFTYIATPAYQWTLIQSKHAQNSSESSQAVSFNSPVTVGNLIVVAITLGGSTTPTVADSAGNSYTQGVNAGYVHMWYAPVTVGGSITVTVSVGSNTGITAAIGEYFYPPGSTLSLEHTEQSGVSSGTTISLTSIPVTMPDLVVMAMTLSQANVTVTPGAPMSTVEYITGGGGPPGIQFQHVLSPLTSPVTSTATLSGAIYWAAVSGAFLAAMPTYELLGQASVASGSPASFEIVPTGTPASDTITLSSSIAGTFSPVSPLTITASPLAVPFTFTPSVAGLATLTLTSTGGHTIGAAPWSLGSYVPFTLTGPIHGIVGSASTAFTLTPTGTTSDVITFSSSSGGTFTPTSLTWASSSAAKTFTFTPSSSGSQTITPISQDSAPITGSPFAYFAAGVVTTNYVCKSGTLAIFGTAAATGQSNGAWPLSSITEVNVDPVISVNGSVVSIGPATWTEADKNTPIVAYRLNCGSVRSIPMANAGANYTAPTATASGGGGSGLTLGTPILGVGVTSYTITNAGSGIGGVSQLVQASPGGTFTSSFFNSPAWAWVTISGGMVTNVVPASGSVQGMGAGYDPSVTSYTFMYGNATITAHVSIYIQSVPVLTSGSGYTSPPTIAFSDSTGTGAVAAPIMNGPASTDVCTYTVADGWLSTISGPNLGATNGVLENFVGVNEGPNGNMNGFRATPTVLMGGQFGAGASNSQIGYLWFGKNKLKSAGPWKASTGTSSFALDSNFFPVSWTAGGTIRCQFYADASGNGVTAEGTWRVVYDDEFYATPSRAPAATTVFLTDAGAMNLTLVSTVVSGTTVTITYTSSHPAGFDVNFTDLEFNVTAPSDGLWHLKNQAGVSDPWVFAPGNIPDRSRPFAADDAMVTALTGPSGSVPACFRAMDTFGTFGGWQNWISGTDFPPTTLFSYSVPYADSDANTIPQTPPFSSGNPLPSGTAFFQFARFLNTDSSNSTYAWSSPRIYSTDAWANSGTDSFGNYLDLTAGPNGAADNGSFLVGSPNPDSGILELRSTSPHGLRSRQLINLEIFGGSANIPWTSFGTLPFLAESGGNGEVQIYVTGPNTIIFTYGVGSGGTGSATQTVNSTTEVPVSIRAQVAVPISPNTMPIELLAGVVADFPGSIAWVNLPQIGDDSIYTTMAQKMAANIGPTNDVVLEFGNEHWNFASAFHEWPSEIQAKNLGRYMPPGQTLWGRWPTNNGDIAADGTSDLFYVLKGAHAADVFTTAWVAAGLSATRIKRMHGAQWGGGDGGKIKGYYTTYSAPAPYGMCIAPYQGFIGRNTNGSPLAAFTAAGYPGWTPGNWPVDAINDFGRHLFFYNADNWSNWQGQFVSLPVGALMCCYESGMDFWLPDALPFTQMMSEDCLYHPSYYDVLHAYELAIQQGNPLVAGTGVVLQSYFTLWGGGGFGMPLWRLGSGFSQPAGLGLNNSFNTPQGGLAIANSANGLWPLGYATVNQQPGIQLLVDWNAAASTPTPTPTPTTPVPVKAAVLVGI